VNVARVLAAATGGHNGRMAVRDDCRHYVLRTTAAGDRLEKCRLDAAEPLPFACPEHCIFFEPRTISSAGWTVDDPDPPT
jgi:hypothetical protein